MISFIPSSKSNKSDRKKVPRLIECVVIRQPSIVGFVSMLLKSCYFFSIDTGIGGAVLWLDFCFYIDRLGVRFRPESTKKRLAWLTGCSDSAEWRSLGAMTIIATLVREILWQKSMVHDLIWLKFLSEINIPNSRNIDRSNEKKILEQFWVLEYLKHLYHTASCTGYYFRTQSAKWGI